MLKRFLILLAVTSSLAFTATQEKQDKIKIRLLYGETQEGVVVKVEEDGITLKLDYSHKPVKFIWAEIFPDDVEFIKYKYLAHLPKETPKEYTVPAVKITTSEGKVYEGVELKESPLNEVWLKNVKGKFVIERTSIKSKETIRIEIAKIYTDEELDKLLLGPDYPTTAEDFEKLARAYVRAQYPERAVPLFKIADILRNPQYAENSLYRDLIRLRDQLSDANLKKITHNLQSEILSGRFDESIELINKIEQNTIVAQNLKLLDEIKRIRSQLFALRQISKEEQLVGEWYRTLEALLRSKAMDTKSSLKAAKSFVENQIRKEIMALVGDRFKMKKDDKSMEHIWESRSNDLILKHSYEEATWLAESIQTSDPEEFWANSNPDVKYSYLKGLYIEKHMKSVKVDHKNCSTCGGRGTIDREKFNFPTSDRCPSCLGLGRYRFLLYK